MSETPSERRLAENEVVFRTLNEQVYAGYVETNDLAKEDNQPEFIVNPHDEDEPLHFYCECSDETCAKRVRINLHEYEKIHEHRDQFTIVTGHETLTVEKVIEKNENYSVVKKRIYPPETVHGLHPTSVKHS